MSKQHDVKISLHDILECSKNCLEFIEGMDFFSFQQDIKTTSAVLHQILIIGEAVKRLGTNFSAKHPVLPWSKMAGIRDILIHHYEDADLSIAWAVVKNDLPTVIVEVKKILESLEK